MNVIEPAVGSCGKLSAAARKRMLTRRGEPWFLADWMRVVMIHFEVDADALQRDVPYELDLRDGRAFVSLVAFTMEDLHPRIGGRLGVWLFRPIATHHFLNVRTYVRAAGEPGIYFIAEWLSNPLAVRLGPVTFGLPYRHGRIAYHHAWQTGKLAGCVEDCAGCAAFAYRGEVPSEKQFAPCEVGSLDEWLMERYTAFTCWRSSRRFFRIWHPSWPQCEVNVDLLDDSLLRSNWAWFRDARLTAANYSPCIVRVWMGEPHAAGKPRR